MPGPSFVRRPFTMPWLTPGLRPRQRHARKRSVVQRFRLGKGKSSPLIGDELVVAGGKKGVGTGGDCGFPNPRAGPGPGRVASAAVHRGDRGRPWVRNG